MKIYREKTLLNKIVDAMNGASKRYIHNFLSILESLKSTIQGITKDSILLNFANILGDKTDKRFEFAVFINSLEQIVNHYIEVLKRQEKNLPVAEYRSKRARNKELRMEYTRQGRRLLKKFMKGKINRTEFHEKRHELQEKDDFLNIHVLNKKTSHEPIIKEDNFVDLSSESSGSEKFTACTANKTTKTTTEGKD